MKVRLEATLKDVNGNPVPGRTIEFYKSTDGENYTLIGTSSTDNSGKAVIEDEVEGTTYYKAYFPGDDVYDSSVDYTSIHIEVQPETQQPQLLGMVQTVGQTVGQMIQPLLQPLLLLLILVLILKLVISLFKE